jgi:hypothetical protein
MLSLTLEKETITFEPDDMKFTQPLDPYQGPWYIERANDNLELDVLDQLNNMTIGKWANYINPTADGAMSLRSVQYANEDSKVAFNDWYQGRHEIFYGRCTTFHSVRWIGTKICNYPTYDETSYLQNFLVDMECKVAEGKWI